MIVITTVVGPPSGDDGGTVVDGPTRQVGTLGYRWRGWSGQEWDLVDPNSKVAKVRGATGFGFAEVVHAYDDAPAIPGSVWGGSRDSRGTLFLPIVVRGDDSADFLAVHRAFCDTLDPDTEGILVVTTPAGDERWARCRYASGLDSPVDIDPVASCKVAYPVGWDRADPYWLGETVTATFTEDPADVGGGGPPFFSAAGASSVVTIASSNTLSEGTVSNPGQVRAFPRWRVVGPCTGFTVGVGDGPTAAVVAMTASLTADQFIDIDMDPRRLTVVDHTGTSRLADATALRFAAIPPGDDIPLTMVIAGGGAGSSATLEFTARYRTAW